MSHLRPYQVDLLDRIDAAFAGGSRRVLLQLPTGGGKTVIFAEHARRHPERVAVVAHRRELIRQAHAKMPGSSVYPSAAPSRVTVGSVQTLARRAGRLPQFGRIVFDEAHHAVAGQYAALIADQPGARVLGVTATPERLDGRGLGEVFDTLIIGPSAAELTDAGYLVPAVCYGQAAPVDLKGVRRIAGDFNTADLEQIMAKPSLIGSAVEHYERLAGGRPAIVFECSVALAEQSAAAFRAEGWRAKSVHGGMTEWDRDAAFADFSAGRLQVITSCSLIDEGLDIPDVGCVIMRRPTESLGRYLQQVGRGLRTAPGKRDCIVLDHAGNVLRHGLPSADRTWSLNAGKRGGEAVPKVKQCESCYALIPPGPVCPCCGHDFRPEQAAAERRRIEEREGALVLLTEADRRIKALRETPLKELLAAATTHDDLAEIGRARRYHPRWADRQAAFMRHRKPAATGGVEFGAL